MIPPLTMMSRIGITLPLGRPRRAYSLARSMNRSHPYRMLRSASATTGTFGPFRSAKTLGLKHFREARSAVARLPQHLVRNHLVTVCISAQGQELSVGNDNIHGLQGWARPVGLPRLGRARRESARALRRAEVDNHRQIQQERPPLEGPPKAKEKSS